MLIVILVLMFAVAGGIWLFFGHGIDRIRYSEEWQNTGSSGERIVYNAFKEISKCRA